MLKKFILIIPLALLTPCSFSEKNIKLATKKQMQEYVNTNYGKADFVRSSENQNEHIKYYTFSDSQYGFEYSSSSYASAISVDGSVFGYTEEKSSDFDEKYYEYIKNQIAEDILKLEKDYNFQTEWLDYPCDDAFAYVRFQENYSESNTAEAMQSFGKLVSDIDTRQYYNYIYAYDVNNNPAGKFDFVQKKYINQEESDIQFFMENAEIICGGKVEYLYSETMIIKDIPGIENHSLAHILGQKEKTLDDSATLYYFEYKGEKYFICDVNVDNAEFFCSYQENKNSQ